MVWLEPEVLQDAKDIQEKLHSKLLSQSDRIESTLRYMNFLIDKLDEWTESERREVEDLAIMQAQAASRRLN